MKLGITAFLTDETIRPDRLATAVEERGFSSLFLGEHSNIPASRRTPHPATPDGALPRSFYRMLEPLIALTAAAMSTTSITLGTCAGWSPSMAQRVGMFYGSANFDEDVFDQPRRCDILLDPNPHLSFGGNGTPYCIGANLARLEIELMFNAIADQIPDIELTSEPRRLRSGWLNGIKQLQAVYHRWSARTLRSSRMWTTVCIN